MNQIGEVQAACAKDLIDKEDVREDQRPSGDKDEWHQEVQYCKIGNFLQWIEFAPAVYRVRRIFTAKDTEEVIPGLNRNLFYDPAPSDPVIHAISRKHIAEKDYEIVHRQEYAGNIMQ
jgi:hypothetical protein